MPNYQRVSSLPERSPTDIGTIPVRCHLQLLELQLKKESSCGVSSTGYGRPLSSQPEFAALYVSFANFFLFCSFVASRLSLKSDVRSTANFKSSKVRLTWTCFAALYDSWDFSGSFKAHLVRP